LRIPHQGGTGNNGCRAVRLSSVGKTVASEVLYTVREQQCRKEQQANAEFRSRE